jgi:hypothetical protein
MEHIVLTCERAAPIVGWATAIGACAAIGTATAGFGLPACAAGAALATTVSAGVAQLTDHACTNVRPLYDACLTATWGGAKTAIQHTENGNANVWDTASLTLDGVSNGLPVAGVLVDGGEAAAKAAGRDASFLDKAIAAVKATPKALKTAAKGGTSDVAQALKASGDRLLAGPAGVNPAAAAGLGEAAGEAPTLIDHMLYSPKYAAGAFQKSAGAVMDSTLARSALKVAVPSVEGAVLNPVALQVAGDAAKASVSDQPPAEKPTGTPSTNNAGTAGASGESLLRVDIIQPTDGEYFAFDQPITFEWSATGEAVVSTTTWIQADGSAARVKLAPGDEYDPPAHAPLTVSRDYKLPPGKYELTVVATGIDGSLAENDVNVSIMDKTGQVPPAPNSCTVDLNHDGTPDCIDALTGTFDGTIDAQPNTLVVILGFLLVLCIGAFAVTRWVGGEGP